MSATSRALLALRHDSAPRRESAARRYACGGGDRRAVAALEFALIAPLLLTLLFAMIFYGAYFTTWIAVIEAASEGARASLAGMSGSERQTLATGQISAVFASYSPLFNPQYVTVSFPTTSSAGTFAVRVSFDFSKLGFASLGTWVPVPNSKPALTVTAGNGGY